MSPMLDLSKPIHTSCPAVYDVRRFLPQSMRQLSLSTGLGKDRGAEGADLLR